VGGGEDDGEDEGGGTAGRQRRGIRRALRIRRPAAVSPPDGRSAAHAGAASGRLPGVSDFAEMLQYRPFGGCFRQPEPAALPVL